MPLADGALAVADEVLGRVSGPGDKAELLDQRRHLVRLGARELHELEPIQAQWVVANLDHRSLLCRR
jgi:hypothetical protein